MKTAGGVSSSIGAAVSLLVAACVAGTGFSTSTSAGHHENLKPVAFAFNVKGNYYAASSGR